MAVEEMTCSVCGCTVDLMAVYEGKVFCFACLGERYRDLAVMLVRYLTEAKGVKPR